MLDPLMGQLNRGSVDWGGGGGVVDWGNGRLLL